ncbi:MAG TPA: hypothetical protein VGB24_23150 [Longimicrobium sp.]|jgi:hypothetical protein|uniref:hypothetical protein n=1 Tax=Longimicrobium sp. TaxID=2029185 RepID=UPI002ED9D5AC
MNRKLAVYVALLALPLAACEEPDGGPSYLRASLSGAVAEEYRGNAEWHVGGPGPGQQSFQMVSVGMATDSDADQFAMTRWDGGRMTEGRYPVALVDLGDQHDYRFIKGLTIQYFRQVNGRMEQFVADSGFVEITRSDENEVSGTFTITAFRYCMRQERTHDEAPECARRWQDVEGTPRITVTGTFMSTKFNPPPTEVS